MHAYLIIGNSSDGLKEETEKLVKKLQAKLMPYTVTKIEDVRNLNNFTRLSLNEKTLLFIENIHEATIEALNAFLKNLEEPQENLYFALSAPSVRKVLPTIVSRCQIIKVQNLEKKSVNENIKKFVNLKTGEKLAYIDKIKDREEAIRLTEDVIYYIHNLLHSNKVKYRNTAKNAEVATQTLINLKANGNVSLQLANFAINLI